MFVGINQWYNWGAHVECEVCLSSSGGGHGEVGLDVCAPAEDEAGEGSGCDLWPGRRVLAPPQGKHHAGYHLNNTCRRLHQSSLHSTFTHVSMNLGINHASLYRLNKYIFVKCETVKYS